MPSICAMCPQKIITRAKVPLKCNFANKSALFPQAAPCPFSILGRTLDYVGPPFVRSSVRPFVRSSVRWYFLSPLDGASVREAHCEQGSTAVREAHCAQATVARLVTFESLKWKYSFATNSALFMKLGSLLYVRCRHRSAKSTAVSNKTFLFQVTNIYLFCGSVTLST